MFAAACIPAITLGVGMFFMPNSPRWLISKGFVDCAKKILQKIRATDDVDQEMTEIQESLNQQKGSIKELLTPAVRPCLIIGIGLAIFQQVTGINTVIYYAPTIFQFAGFHSAASSILATLGIGIVNVLVTLLAIHLVDKIGRRPLLLIGLAGMALSLITLGIGFDMPKGEGDIGLISVISLMFYVGFFAIGMGPVFWLLISELYPLKIRGVAMSVATFFNWGSNLVIGITFLTLLHAIGKPKTFWVYGALSVVTWLFVFFLVPETKGKSLEQIEAHFRKGKKPLELGK